MKKTILMPLMFISTLTVSAAAKPSVAACEKSCISECNGDQDLNCYENCVGSCLKGGSQLINQSGGTKIPKTSVPSTNIIIRK